MHETPFPWGHERRFNAYTEHIHALFGERVQKVAVDAGFTCPNRDGTVGTGGCTYCDNDAFNPSYCNPTVPLHEQIRRGIDFHAIRYRRAKRFLVYFQPYSNTYAPLDRLKARYEEALSYPGIEGLVIGTRPDCMDDEKLDYLEELSRRVYLQVEYGIETHRNDTLWRINRGYDDALARRIVEKTSARGIRTGGHYIFGLPGETEEQMLEMAGVISSLPFYSVKFHQLQIVNDTRMEVEYRDRPEDFFPFTLESYIDFIIRFIERLNPALVIERFSGEVPPRFIKGHNLGLVRHTEVLRRIEAELNRRDTWQGRCYA